MAWKRSGVRIPLAPLFVSRVIVPMVSRDFLLRGMLSGLGRRCQCFFGSGSPISTLFRSGSPMSAFFWFWVANVAIGRRCLGELSAMYADIGNLIGLFEEEAVGILLASTTGRRCRPYPPPPPRDRIASTVSGPITACEVSGHR
jgi:hypothetical protein